MLSTIGSNDRPANLGRRALLRLSLWAALLTTGGVPLGFKSSRTAVGAGPPKLPVGMNLSAVTDWEPGFPFLNLMWGARAWITRTMSEGGPWSTDQIGELELDDDGYPLEMPFRPASTRLPEFVFTILPNTLKPGRYVLLHDGEGEFWASGATRIVNAMPGRVELSMQHRGGEVYEMIGIRRSRRGNHVRNIRIVALEYEHVDLDRNPFRPEVIEFCAPWHCLRFMLWQQTNDSIEQTWAARKRRTFYTQCGATGDVFGLFGAPLPDWQRKWSSGVAIELCLQLANLTQTDCWLCVPHLADDQYISEMAKLVKATLDPSLKVYVEFSNELWNWQFQQAQWMLRSEVAGDLVVASGGAPPWKDGSRPNQFRNGMVAAGAGEGTGHPERIGALFRRCFKIWEDVFSGDDRSRLVTVCAVQAGWPDTVDRTLNWVMRNGGCDALSPAGYFGPDEKIYAKWEAAGASLTANDVIDDLKTIIAKERSRLEVNMAFAKSAGIRYVVYEGGQHVQPLNQAEKPYNAALGDAQKHPGMYDLYQENLQQLADAGCDLFCAFTSVGLQGTRWGSWGHLERYGQDPAEMPKFRALLDANTSRKAR